MTALVQGPLEAVSASPASTIARAFADDVTAGNAIIVVVRGVDITFPEEADTFGITVADSLGNTYTLAVASGAYGTRTTNAIIFYAKNIAGGSCTVTATFDRTADRQGIMVFEVSGLDTSAAILEATNSATGTSTTPNAGNVTSAEGGFLLAVAINDSAYVGMSAGAGWTAETTGAIWNRALVEYRIEATGGTFAGDFTQSSATAWTAIVAAFKPAAAGGGITGTLSQTLDGATLSAGGALAIEGEAAPTLSSATLSSAAALALQAELAATLAGATLSAAAKLALQAELAATLAGAGLASTAALANSGELAAALAGVTLSATGRDPNADLAVVPDFIIRNRRRRWS